MGSPGSGLQERPPATEGFTVDRAVYHLHREGSRVPFGDHTAGKDRIFMDREGTFTGLGQGKRWGPNNTQHRRDHTVGLGVKSRVPFGRGAARGVALTRPQHLGYPSWNATHNVAKCGW